MDGWDVVANKRGFGDVVEEEEDDAVRRISVKERRLNVSSGREGVDEEEEEEIVVVRSGEWESGNVNSVVFVVLTMSSNTAIDLANSTNPFDSR